MLRKFLPVFLFLCSVFFILFTAHHASAGHCPEKDYDCQIAEIQKTIDSLKPAHEQNQKELASLRQEIKNIQARLNSISGQLNALEADIKTREEDLAFQEILLEEKIRNFYIKSRQYSLLVVFLSSSNASEFTRELAIRSQVASQDRQEIEDLVGQLVQLREDKETLERSRASLQISQKQLDDRADFLAVEVEKVGEYLAQLSSKQESILAAKLGAFTVSVGDSELADDYYASIKGFREAAPSGSFAAFSFGGYTHRKGMSQYGARGRANSGQDYKAILRAYYGKEPVGKDTSGTINVSGFGAMDFETTYLYGIAEMPSSFPKEALKAQAVAARTYAYRYKLQGTSICTTETCQVFRKLKSDNPPSEWKQAVDGTKGQVLEDVVTYYSSTTGGYITTMGWDTTDGSGGSNFLDKTYEKIGGSPWVYKAWYTKGYSPSSDKCGRGNPWLTGTEFADIVNAALVLENGTQGEVERITPVTTSCWGGNPYSHDELRDVAGKYGGINSVASVSTQQGNGSTDRVIVNGNIFLSGEEFKKAFNLRAPGYLGIPQRGFAFFNVEKK